MCMCTMCVPGALREQKAFDSLKLELEAILFFLIWVLDSEFKSSGRTASAFKCEPCLQLQI